MGTRLSFFLIAAALAWFVIHSVARIEDKFLQTHPFFFDPLSYQCHQCQLWLESQQTSRLDLALKELSQDTDVPDPLRTIPLILLNPGWLRDPHAHLITSGLGLFIFLSLLLYTVHRRTGSRVYAFAAGLLVCAIPGFYDPVLGLGAFWLDLTAGFYGGAAALCLVNSQRGSSRGWLAGFAILAAMASLARFVTGPYLALQCGPILAIYLFANWRKTGNLFRAVIQPVLLIATILTLLIGWYLWKETPSVSYYYATTGYGYQDVLRSFQFVLSSTVSFLTVPLAIFLTLTAVVHGWFGARTRWNGLLEALWLAISVGLFLSITTIIGPAIHAIQYFVPIAAFALLCPVDLKPTQHARPMLAVIGAVSLLVASFFLWANLNTNLWRLPPAQPEDQDRKIFYETVTRKLCVDYPQQVVAAYFDEFDEYVYLIGIEHYGRPPNLLPDRVFSVHESYLYSAFPGKTTADLVEMAWRQANEKSDLILTFNDPNTSKIRSSFAYGNYLNPVCSAIAFEMARRVQTDSGWRKLFIVPSKYLPGGVAVYANLNRFPNAGPSQGILEPTRPLVRPGG